MADVYVNTVLLFGGKVVKTSSKVFYSTTSGAGNFTEANTAQGAPLLDDNGVYRLKSR